MSVLFCKICITHWLLKLCNLRFLMILVPYNMCVLCSHTTQRLLDTSWASYNSTQFWHHLPRDSLQSHRLRAQSYESALHFRHQLKVQAITILSMWAETRTTVIFRRDRAYSYSHWGTCPGRAHQCSDKRLYSPFIWWWLSTFPIAKDTCRKEATFIGTSSSEVWMHPVSVLRDPAIPFQCYLCVSSWG